MLLSSPLSPEERVSEILVRGFRLPESVADHSSADITEIKNAWSRTSIAFQVFMVR
jgi:hypothetical protein